MCNIVSFSISLSTALVKLLVKSPSLSSCLASPGWTGCPSVPSQCPWDSCGIYQTVAWLWPRVSFALSLLSLSHSLQNLKEWKKGRRGLDMGHCACLHFSLKEWANTLWEFMLLSCPSTTPPRPTTDNSAEGVHTVVMMTETTGATVYFRLKGKSTNKPPITH